MPESTGTPDKPPRRRRTKAEIAADEAAAAAAEQATEPETPPRRTRTRKPAAGPVEIAAEDTSAAPVAEESAPEESAPEESVDGLPETVAAASDAGSHEPLSLDAPQFQPAAKHPQRAEMVVALCFLLGVAGFIGFGVAYWQNSSSEVLGATIGIGFLAVGAAMVAWGKYLMPAGPFVEDRHRLVPTAEERARFVGDFASRGQVAIERRGFLGKMMAAALGVMSVVAAFPLLRSLGPLPGGTLYSTAWTPHAKLVTIDGTTVTADFLDVGGAVTVFPEDDIGGAYSQTMLIRAAATALPATRPGRENWGPAGYLAYSKVCTHAGCPVGLYQEETQQLLCPCHQSLFDVLDGAEPVFGPAPRPLPQLPLYIDDDGVLRAQADYDEPVGPGFWERGND